jgi:hypothetical protein
VGQTGTGVGAVLWWDGTGIGKVQVQVQVQAHSKAQYRYKYRYKYMHRAFVAKYCTATFALPCQLCHRPGNVWCNRKISHLQKTLQTRLLTIKDFHVDTPSCHADRGTVPNQLGFIYFLSFFLPFFFLSTRARRAFHVHVAVAAWERTCPLVFRPDPPSH